MSGAADGPDFLAAYGAEKARKVHERRVAVAKREKEQDDQRDQFELYRKGNRNKLTELLKNPYVGDKVGALIKFLKTLGPESAPALVDYIERSEWLRNADDDIRQACLGYISTAIMRLRVRHGLAPFDDSIDDEPLTAFQIIRKHLMGV